jgi:hypothetical protein
MPKRRLKAVVHLVDDVHWDAKTRMRVDVTTTHQAAMMVLLKSSLFKKNPMDDILVNVLMYHFHLVKTAKYVRKCHKDKIAIDENKEWKVSPTSLLIFLGNMLTARPVREWHLPSAWQALGYVKAGGIVCPKHPRSKDEPNSLKQIFRHLVAKIVHSGVTYFTDNGVKGGEMKQITLTADMFDIKAALLVYKHPVVVYVPDVPEFDPYDSDPDPLEAKRDKGRLAKVHRAQIVTELLELKRKRQAAALVAAASSEDEECDKEWEREYYRGSCAPCLLQRAGTRDSLSATRSSPWCKRQAKPKRWSQKCCGSCLRFPRASSSAPLCVRSET